MDLSSSPKSKRRAWLMAPRDRRLGKPRPLGCGDAYQEVWIKEGSWAAAGMKTPRDAVMTE